MKKNPKIFSILITLIVSAILGYIEIGIFFEERQLVREYKNNYIEYQKTVPKINPFFYIVKMFYRN